MECFWGGIILYWMIVLKYILLVNIWLKEFVLLSDVKNIFFVVNREICKKIK